MSESWAGRAAVKKPERDVDALFDDSMPDFLVDLLPFRDHPAFESAPQEYQQAALSCGWLAYNEKTVSIESKIVSPACMHLIDGDFPELRDETYRRVASEALVDESYHILLIVNACRVTRQRRQLGDLRIPQFELIREMWKCQEDHPERWQKILVQLACAVVSEVMVSDYLKLLSGTAPIQPLNRLTTEIHRRDEAAHNAIFKTLGAALYHTRSQREREFFMQLLPKPIEWFASQELVVWRSMLQQIGFPGSDRMIDDCEDSISGQAVHLDLSTLNELYTDLGIDASRCSMH